MKSIIVLPTYNERENIDSLLTTVLELEPPLDVLVIDDASPDGTGLAADAWTRKTPRVRVTHRPGKLGLGTAYLEGFRRVLAEGYDRVLQMDADFSHHPSYVPGLIEKTSQCDISIGSRYVDGGGTRGWGLHRRILSRTANGFARFMLGFETRDCTAAFRCFRTDILRKIDLGSILADGYSFQVEILVRALQAGATVAEIPIVFEDRKLGRSKISRSEIFKAAGTVFRLAKERLTRRT